MKRKRKGDFKENLRMFLGVQGFILLNFAIVIFVPMVALAPC